MTLLKGLLLPLFLLLWWWSTSVLQLINNYLLPSPATVLQTTVSLIEKGLLLHHVETS